MSILDMSLRYTDCFVSFAGDTTHDVSRVSLRSVTRHRSRRLRAQRRNVIGFADASAPSLLPSDSSDSDDDGADGGASATSFSFGASFVTDGGAADEGALARLDKMSSELDALVRFVRRGVESLAAGTSEAAPAVGIFAFALGAWDR